MPKDDVLLFTEEMRKDYTILIPNMLPIHFKLLCEMMNQKGYSFKLLENENSNVVREGLKNVHNDTCYPALVVIGQFLDAIKSGKYDTDKIALAITQTGGGCRASNYINLLRKALKENGYGHIPVLSVSANAMEKHPGFKLTPAIVISAIYSIVYGDLLMWLKNQSKPYEVNKGEVDKLVFSWENRLLLEYKQIRNLRLGKIRKNFIEIVKDFEKVRRSKEKKVKVGIVGEIFVKFSGVGNNNLEKFLEKEDCEIVLPGLLDFIIYTIDSRLMDYKLYGGNKFHLFWYNIAKKVMLRFQNQINFIIKRYSTYMPISRFEDVKSLVTNDYVSHGNKMGEGWLLTAEMLELCHMGVYNIVCAQPFGCLPNHIVGRGMVRKIKENIPNANIVAIDYDPSATKVNQENRIKLMLANAKV
ncbi:MAG: hypothetical protein ACK5LV_09950 [Lachnospirales bacterium]